MNMQIVVSHWIIIKDNVYVELVAGIVYDRNHCCCPAALSAF